MNAQSSPQAPRKRKPALIAGAAALAVLLVGGAAAFALGELGEAEVADTPEPIEDETGLEAAPDPADSELPERTFERFDGTEGTLADYLGGNPLVVNFFASWCPPCVAEMRDALQPLHEELGDEVQFLGIALQDEREQALAIVEQTGVTYELADDPQGDLFSDFGGIGMPTTIYISPEGEIVRQHTGALTKDEFRAQIEELKEAS